MERLLEGRRMEETGMEFKHVRRGWCLGDTASKKELLGQMNTRVGAEHYGVEREETAEARAESIVCAELRRRHWDEAGLARRPKGDPVKVALATRLRKETARTVKWIADRLRMGTPSQAHHLLYLNRKET